MLILTRCHPTNQHASFQSISHSSAFIPFSHQSLPSAIFLPSLLDRFIFLNKTILQESSRDFIKMASDDGIRGVTCNAILEKLGSNGEVTSVKKFPNSNDSVIRISGSQIGLSIQFRSVSIKLEIEKGSLKGKTPPRDDVVT